MKAARAPVSIRLMIMLGTLLAGISSCRFMPASQTLGMRTLSLSAASASVLVIIVNQGSLSAMRATGALEAASARPRERVFILGSQGGAPLASSQAPPSPTARVTDPPAPLSSQPTSFQKARYRQAVRQYRAVLLGARRALQKEQQQELAAWASSTVAKAAVRPVLRHPDGRYQCRPRRSRLRSVSTAAGRTGRCARRYRDHRRRRNDGAAGAEVNSQPAIQHSGDGRLRRHRH